MVKSITKIIAYLDGVRNQWTSRQISKQKEWSRKPLRFPPESQVRNVEAVPTVERKQDLMLGSYDCRLAIVGHGPSAALVAGNMGAWHRWDPNISIIKVFKNIIFLYINQNIVFIKKNNNNIFLIFIPNYFYF